MIKNSIKKIVYHFIKPKYFTLIDYKTSNNLLDGKVALILGGDGGIGFEIAKKIVEAGAKVILLGRNKEKLENCINIIGENNSKYIICDLSNIDNFKSVIDDCIKYFKKIDILVNAAGIHIARKDLNLFNITEKEYDSILNVNLKSIYFFTQLVSKYMIDNKIKGHILFISSSRGSEPIWSPYQISKQAITGITEGFAQQLIKYNIVVNGIAPGPTATQLINFKEGDSIYSDDTLNNRLTLPLEIANYATLLVSGMGDTIVGQTLYLSSGRGIIDKR